MLLNHYSPTTGEYLSTSTAPPSPLEPGEYQTIAYATPIAPPSVGLREAARYLAKDGSVPEHYAAGHWTVHADWRSTQLYSTEDGREVSIQEIGVTPADVRTTETPRPTPAHVWTDGAWVHSEALAAQLLAQYVERACASIDAEADASRLAIAGDPLRMIEYERAAIEARAYKDAGYSGAVPPAVVSWAEAKGWSGKDAADNILAEAAAWNQALYTLRDMRLKGKEAVRVAGDEEAATLAAEAAIAQIRSVARIGNAVA